MRPRLIASLGVTLALTVGPVRGGAQTVSDSGRGVTATLLKRLGEIVDGHRGGGSIYVVISYRFPHTVAAVTASHDSALVAARVAGNLYGVFGPYESSAESSRGELYATQPCIKNPTTSVIYCGDTTMVYSPAPVPMVDVRTVTISVTTSDGKVHTQTFGPERVEAVFFTMASIDKFAIPYYERVLGVEFAANLRTRLQAAFGIGAAH